MSISNNNDELWMMSDEFMMKLKEFLINIYFYFINILIYSLITMHYIFSDIKDVYILDLHVSCLHQYF